MVSGIFCIHCNIYIHSRCLKKADNQFQCKKICNSIFSINKQRENSFEISKKEALIGLKDGPFRLHMPKMSHHWIKGNLKLNTFCYLCLNECCDSPGLNDFKCVWCMRNVHEKCLIKILTDAVLEECDCGKFKRLLLTPIFVVQIGQTPCLSLRNIRLESDLINSLFRNEPNDWTPLFVFANSKSGNADADSIIISLSTILNPLQIVEMNKINPDEVVRWMVEYSNLVMFKILVCGGDGSVGWVLESLSKVQFKVSFVVCPA